MTDSQDLDRLRPLHDVLVTNDGNGDRHWISVADYVALEAKFFEYRQALAMINAYHWQGDLGNKIRGILNHFGFGGAMARATNEIIYQVNHGGL